MTYDKNKWGAAPGLDIGNVAIFRKGQKCEDGFDWRPDEKHAGEICIITDYSPDYWSKYPDTDPKNLLVSNALWQVRFVDGTILNAVYTGQLTQTNEQFTPLLPISRPVYAR